MTLQRTERIENKNDHFVYTSLALELVISHQLATWNQQKSVENYILHTIVI